MLQTFLEDNILSTLCLFLLRFGGIVVDDINDRSNLRDFTLKIGGIGDVCTLPKVMIIRSYRGLGNLSIYDNQLQEYS